MLRRNGNWTLALALALAAPTLPEMLGQIVVSYSPNVSTTVDAPIRGLGATDDDYLLTHVGDWSSINRNLSGNEIVRFTNPTSAQDAASFDNEYMFQLGEDNNLLKVNLSTGAQTPFNSNNSINLGPHTFGIGYDAGTGTLGIGQFDGGQMTFRTYAVGTGVFSDPVSFAFDSSQYGTPTGLDYVVQSGAARMLVGTRDGPDNRNYVLDTDALTGDVGQFFTRAPNLGWLTDVEYSQDSNRLALSYNNSNFDGRIEVGDFTVIPEPRYSAFALALGGLCLVFMRRLRTAEGR